VLEIRTLIYRKSLILPIKNRLCQSTAALGLGTESSNALFAFERLQKPNPNRGSGIQGIFGVLEMRV